jgi:hypothetical protein
VTLLSPDAVYWIGLVFKMVAAAGVVLAATVIAERAGPLIGSLIATLPVSTGPAYILLAFDHDDAFIARSALASVAINIATAFYSVTYAKLAQRHSLPVCLSAGLVSWFAAALFVHVVDWTLLTAILANAIVFPIGIYLVRDLRHAPMPRVPARWYELLIRALGVALLMGAVVTLSFVIGPQATGILAVFPITYTSIMFILYRRVGGPAAAAVPAHGLSGLVGFGAAMVTIHLAAVPLGAAPAIVLAFAVSIAWNLMLFAVNRRSRGRPA